MKEQEAAAQIDEAAHAWIARIDREGRTAEIEQALEAWLAGDARRRGAFLRAEAIWQKLDRASQSRFHPARQDPDDEAPVTRRLLLAGGGGLLAAGIAVAAWLRYAHDGGDRVETALGEMRRMTLTDGSVMVLNTDSRADVAMQSDVRLIHLASGEAWFDVKKNPARPFLVEAGPVRVQAVGTAFCVRCMEGGAEVSVTEGAVDAWIGDDGARKVRIRAGEKALMAMGRPLSATPVGEAEIARRLAWRSGEIDLNGETLAEAVAEFNRYNARKLVLSDARLGSRRVYGLFRTNDPEGFARAVSVALGVAVAFDPDAIAIGG